MCNITFRESNFRMTLKWKFKKKSCLYIRCRAVYAFRVTWSEQVCLPAVRVVYVTENALIERAWEDESPLNSWNVAWNGFAPASSQSLIAVMYMYNYFKKMDNRFFRQKPSFYSTTFKFLHPVCCAEFLLQTPDGCLPVFRIGWSSLPTNHWKEHFINY